MGTFGWTTPEARRQRARDTGHSWEEIEEGAPAPRGAHFDPMDFESLGPAVSVEVNP